METEKFKTAFDMLYMPLCMFALRILGNKEDAEDCVQQGFSSLYIAQKEGKDIEELKPYLYRAVRNLAVSKIREYSRMNDFDNEAVDAVEVSVEAIDTSARDARLWEAIGLLPEKCRRVFLLSKRDGLSNQKISEELSISIKTVENQMTRAYKKLREALMPEGRKVFFLPFL